MCVCVSVDLAFRSQAKLADIIKLTCLGENEMCYILFQMALIICFQETD